MNEVDKAAFEGVWKAHNEYISSRILSNKAQAVDMWNRALEHRDKQTSAGNEQDELQPAANWIYNGLHPCKIADIQESLMVGYNRAKRLYDAAEAAAKAVKGE